jgi:D-alanyl-D-alanine carboxypeptidase
MTEVSVVAFAEAADVAERIAALWAVPGGAIAVSDADGLRGERVFGLADVEAGIPVTPGHLFEIGSISKVATAIAVLQLVDDGMLRLDQSVRELLPWVPSAFRHEHLTVERLLSHTGGLVASIDALPDEVAQLAAFAGASTEPGSVFHYSNVGFLLLGRVVATLTGEDVPTRIRERVLAPVGMRDALAAVTNDEYARLARGYQRLVDDRPWAPDDPLVRAPWLEVAGADGNIAATASDLARFGRVLLRRGRTDDGVRLLSEESFTAMTTPTAPGGEEVVHLGGVRMPVSSRYGLGVNLESHDGGTPTLSHGGGMVGYASFLLVDPDAGLVTAVVTNADGDSPIAEAMARATAATLSGAAVEVPDPLRWDSAAARAAVPSLPAAAGTFADADRSIVVRPTGTGLEVETDAASAPLLWSWSGRAVTRHPSLRRHPLSFGDEAWSWGAHVLRPHAQGPVDGPPAPTTGLASPPDGASAHAVYCGHYRSYSPWFTNFRVVDREGVLTLIASGGVEAPTEDIPLTPLGGRRFRLGTDDRLPETIEFAPPVAGVSPWADRDGARYSRAFTP